MRVVVPTHLRSYTGGLAEVPARGATLADVLEDLVARPDELRRLGAAGRAYVERVHDLSAVADRLLDLYAGLE